MKPEAATKKRCPAGIEDFCVADECMAWRWNSWVPSFRERDEGERNGYCGLAGGPTRKVVGGWGGEQ